MEIACTFLTASIGIAGIGLGIVIGWIWSNESNLKVYK